MERINLDARIEKRLADLMVDLAQHKNMTVGEAIEETLLHSFEVLPNTHSRGVANPHTEKTMKYIDELKKKYNIDYETHDTYRFHEA